QGQQNVGLPERRSFRKKKMGKVAAVTAAYSCLYLGRGIANVVTGPTRPCSAVAAGPCRRCGGAGPPPRPVLAVTETAGPGAGRPSAGREGGSVRPGAGDVPGGAP